MMGQHNDIMPFQGATHTTHTTHTKPITPTRCVGLGYVALSGRNTRNTHKTHYPNAMRWAGICCPFRAQHTQHTHKTISPTLGFQPVNSTSNQSPDHDWAMPYAIATRLSALT
ncbi:hypothetical protein [Candidatus Symbiothrix dinenymphae]|uniref:hypothetical protein n=1 Tax=Candidatus Symbiothrix dinenymphae TaxID=467085 RepID=UPI0013156391|nr:hypothetical protein [Candidatus Symbiothrix dinenymphae]